MMMIMMTIMMMMIIIIIIIINVWSRLEQQIFLFPKSLDRTVAHPTSNSMGTWGFCAGGKTAWARS